MRVGVVLPQTEIGPDPAAVADFARAAEQGGFDFVTAFDHVLGADASSRPDWRGPYTAGDQFHEIFVLFGYLAAVTRLELCTGVLVLPQRQTALVAKQAAEVDLLTGGRLRLGVGVGWNAVEYEALGAGFRDRGERQEEQISLLRALWTQDVVSFRGRFHTVDRAGLAPPPVQRPIPLWLGGGGRSGPGAAAALRVLRRIGRLGDGWIADTPPGDDAAQAWRVVQEAAAAAGREPAAVGLQGGVRVRGTGDGDAVRRQIGQWERLGATHVSIAALGAGLSPGQHVDIVGELGELVRRG